MLKELLSSPATVRVLMIMILPTLSVIPGVSVAPVTHLITIDPYAAWPYLLGGFAAGFGIFAVWGKK